MFPDGVIDYGQYERPDYNELVKLMDWEQMRKLLSLPAEPNIPYEFVHSMQWIVPEPV